VDPPDPDSGAVGLPSTRTVTCILPFTAKKASVARQLDKTVHQVADTPRAANGSARAGRVV
jgi:hypothetical protein